MPSTDELLTLGRKEIQALAKKHGIKANQKSDALIKQLVAATAELGGVDAPNEAAITAVAATEEPAPMETEADVPASTDVEPLAAVSTAVDPAADEESWREAHEEKAWREAHVEKDWREAVVENAWKDAHEEKALRERGEKEAAAAKKAAAEEEEAAEMEAAKEEAAPKEEEAAEKEAAKEEEAVVAEAELATEEVAAETEVAAEEAADVDMRPAAEKEEVAAQDTPAEAAAEPIVMEAAIPAAPGSAVRPSSAVLPTSVAPGSAARPGSAAPGSARSSNKPWAKSPFVPLKSVKPLTTFSAFPVATPGSASLSERGLASVKSLEAASKKKLDDSRKAQVGARSSPSRAESHRTRSRPTQHCYLSRCLPCCCCHPLIFVPPRPITTGERSAQGRRRRAPRADLLQVPRREQGQLDDGHHQRQEPRGMGRGRCPRGGDGVRQAQGRRRAARVEIAQERGEGGCHGSRLMRRRRRQLTVLESPSRSMMSVSV